MTILIDHKVKKNAIITVKFVNPKLYSFLLISSLSIYFIAGFYLIFGKNIIREVPL